MKVLMVGTGSIGRRHMASLRGLVPGVRFDVLREAGRAPDAAGLGEVTVSRTLEEAIAKAPVMIVVANPSSMHLRYIAAAIDSRIAFYAEKPVVATVEDLVLLRQSLRSARMPPNIVGCNLRFLPSLKVLRDMVRGNQLGNVVRASFEAGHWLPDWRPAQDYRQTYSARSELGGGVLLDLVHEIDAARWILGEFVSVQAQTAHLSHLEIDTEDCACMVLRSASGRIATVQLDYVSRRPFRRYRVVGDEASAEWDLPSRSLTVASQDGVRQIELGPDAFDVAATYATAMRELLDAMATDRPSSQPLDEGLRSVDIVLQAKKAFTST